MIVAMCLWLTLTIGMFAILEAGNTLNIEVNGVPWGIPWPLRLLLWSVPAFFISFMLCNFAGIIK